MKNFSVEQAAEILRRTPSVVQKMLAGLPEDWIAGKNSDEKWSAFDIVGHLIHGEETDWIPRAELILGGNSPLFEPFDRYAQLELSKGKSPRELLVRFAELRESNLEKLNSFDLTAEKLKMTGIHPELGEVSLRQLIATWAVHDLNHIAQLARVLSERFTGEVGPWKQYLSILN